MNTITSIIAEKIKDNNLKLFEKLNNETIKVRNPQFVNIHYLFQSNQSPKMSLSILQEEKDGDFYKFMQAARLPSGYALRQELGGVAVSRNGSALTTPR
jgi:hypothetical protein